MRKAKYPAGGGAVWQKIAVLAAGFLFVIGLHSAGILRSYLATLMKTTSPRTEESLPLASEIRRAETMLAQLAQVEDRLICYQASLLVSVRELEHELQRHRQELDRERQQLQELRERLRSDAPADNDTPAGSARSRILAELRRRFQLYQARQELIQQRELLLAEQQRVLENLAEQRRQLQMQQAELAARIQKLHTQCELLQLAQSSLPEGSHVASAELAELRSLLDRLEKRLEVSRLEQQLRREPFAPSISLSDTDILPDAVDQHRSAHP
jgi:Tfp pilus assembly PilM family ATPase